MDFVKDDEELIQMYLWGFKSIWDVRKGISDNHNTDYDLDQIYDYIDCYCNNTNLLKKIEELKVSPAMKEKEFKLKYVLRKIVLDDMQISAAALKLNCKRETVSGYLEKIGYVKPNQYRSKQMQLLLREYCEGRLNKCQVDFVLWINKSNFNIYVRKYKEEHNL